MPLGACHGLYLWLGRWKVASFALGAESIPAMSSIAERLILGHPTPAERNHLPAGKPESVPFKVRISKSPSMRMGPFLSIVTFADIDICMVADRCSDRLPRYNPGYAARYRVVAVRRRPSRLRQKTPREVLMLARVRAHMSSILLLGCRIIPVCRQLSAPAGYSGKRTELIDLVRLEVALVNGRELFAWPGSRSFEDTEIIDMVKGGAIGNGNFALHAKSVFQSNTPRFTLCGRANPRGWTQNIAMGLRCAPDAQRIHACEQGGARGDCWIPRFVLGGCDHVWTLVRLEVYADDIPPKLRIASAADAVEYHRVQLGEEAFLLPRKSELSMTGSERRREPEPHYIHRMPAICGRIDDPFRRSATRRAQVAKKQNERSNSGRRCCWNVELETPVTEASLPLVIPITAILKRSVKLGSGLVAPKGALLHGRITHLRRQQTSRPEWVIGMTFPKWNGREHTRELRASLGSNAHRVDCLPPRTLSTACSRRRGALLERTCFLLPGLSPFCSPRLPDDWRTQPFGQEDKQ